MSDVVHLWSPPQPGENILGMVRFQDVIVIATTHGVYIITDQGHPLPNWEVRRITHNTVKEWK